MVVLENTEDEKLSSKTSKFKIQNYTLESNCNNELKSFQFDPMPSCVTDKCNELLCKPLNEVGIDVEKMNTSSFKQLGEGQFNKVYDITYDENNPIVLRLLRKDRTDYKTIKQEQNGLVYQTRVSKSNDDGGYGCPYIAKVYDFGVYDDDKSYNRSVYAILEKCKMDLFDKMSELDGTPKSITEQQLKNITKQTLEALHCLHEHQIYHLDLKPENIMYNDVENVSDIKIIDFGAALQSQGPEKDLLSSKRYGTPGYISPARLHRIGLKKENRLNSPNAMDDLWSLGITLMKLIFITYEMTTKGKYFFSKFPHDPNVVPRTYYDYNADVLVPTEKAYEEIQTTTLPDFTTGFSQECVDFLRRIFETVSIKNNEVLLRESYFTLSAKELLEDPWLNNGGGKRRTKRKNKKSTNKKKKKSKNTKKRSSKKH
jgi:serine/threonine protein kinase